MDHTRDVKTVCVIGGGLAGVVTVKALITRGFSVTLFEQRDKLGGHWVDTYYGAAVQSDKAMYEYAEKSFPEDFPRNPTANDVLEYVDEFAAEYGVHSCCKLQHEIENISRPNEYSPWTVAYSTPEFKASEDQFDFLVMCTGILSQPYTPTFPGLGDFQGEIVHSTEWKSPAEFDEKQVVIIGNGKGATDAVTAAVGPAKAVHQVIRTKHWYVPLDFFGVIPFENAMLIRATTWMSPAFDGPPRKLEKMLKWLFFTFIWMMFRLIEITLAIHYRFPMHLLPTIKVEVDVGGYSAQAPRPAYYQAVRSKKAQVHISGAKSFTRNAVELQNGDKVDADLVIMATGYTHEFPLLDDQFKDRMHLESDGLWLYRQILHPEIPGLAFVGSNTASFMSSCTFSIQAAWLAKMLTGEMEIPSRATMWKEIEAVKATRRNILRNEGRRSICIMSRVLEYQDMLCRDMGKEPRREGIIGMFLGYFAPALPETYREYVED